MFNFKHWNKSYIFIKYKKETFIRVDKINKCLKSYNINSFFVDIDLKNNIYSLPPHKLNQNSDLHKLAKTHCLKLTRLYFLLNLSVEYKRCKKFLT
jgi:hypothetical protein